MPTVTVSINDDLNARIGTLSRGRDLVEYLEVSADVLQLVVDALVEQNQLIHTADVSGMAPAPPDEDVHGDDRVRATYGPVDHGPFRHCNDPNCVACNYARNHDHAPDGTILKCRNSKCACRSKLIAQ